MNPAYAVAVQKKLPMHWTCTWDVKEGKLLLEYNLPQTRAGETGALRVTFLYDPYGQLVDQVADNLCRVCYVASLQQFTLARAAYERGRQQVADRMRTFLLTEE